MADDNPKILRLVPKSPQPSDETQTERCEALAEYFEEYASLARSGRIDSAVVVSLHSTTEFHSCSYFGIPEDVLKLLGAIEWFKPRLTEDAELEEDQDEGS